MAPHKNNNYHQIRRTLQDHHQNILQEFTRKHASTLENAKNQGLNLTKVAILATALLTSAPSQLLTQTTSPTSSHVKFASDELQTNIKKVLANAKEDKLTFADKEELAKLLSAKFSLDLKPELEGNKLNDVYGYIGQEQHLYRWQGDTLAQHAKQEYGIAPLKGAFGYFDTAEQEEYYIAAQIHELPNWNSDWSTLKPWYRYRKMFIYNPDNGKGIVAVIGDAGPSTWTGKTFGGSPEVMQYLQRVDGGQKGKVVVLFLEDTNNKVALGPVQELNDLALEHSTESKN